MKNPNRDMVSKLEALPNIGKAIASYLRLIGINKPKDLIGQNPFDLHDKLCVKKEKEIDPCVIDVFMAVIDFMEKGEPLPWWEFTEKRKLILKKIN